VGSTEVKREWRTVHAGTLKAGDIIPDFGKIELVTVVGGAFDLTNPSGAVSRFGWSDPVFAFTESTSVVDPTPSGDPIA
jgi:hypothetical protein